MTLEADSAGILRPGEGCAHVDATAVETWQDRVKGLHGNERAQVLPLIFFLGIAFFTSVVLVINTGRTTNRRIKAQNAVDAATVSGANAMARGMNYIASNNLTTSKLLATIVILRSFDPAIEASKVILQVWRGVATTLKGMGAVPYVGPALVALGTAIEIKVQQEERVLDLLDPAVDAIKNVWDNDGNGVAWVLMKGLHYLAVGIAYATPVLAQYAAYIVAERNLDPESGFAFILPIYPALPICQGIFDDYYDFTKLWAEEYAKPIYILSALILTLSLFPLTYYIALKAQLQILFQGGDPNQSIPPPDDPDTKKINELNAEIDQLKHELNVDPGYIPKKNNIIHRLNGTGPYAPPDGPAGGLRATHGINEEPRKSLEEDIVKSTIFPTEQNAKTTEDQIEWRRIKIEGLQDQIETITNNRKDGPIETPDGELGELQNASGDTNKIPKPWLIAEDKYPQGFVVFGLCSRSIEQPIVQVHFERQMSVGFTYASAMVFNPTEFSMFCADWRARLIRVDADNMKSPFNPIGIKKYENCGDSGSDAGGSAPSSPATDAGEEPTDQSSLISGFLDFFNKH